MVVQKGKLAYFCCYLKVCCGNSYLLSRYCHLATVSSFKETEFKKECRLEKDIHQRWLPTKFSRRLDVFCV